VRDKLEAFARRHGLFDGVEQVVCALSGGPDSVCLLHLLKQLQPEFGYALSAAHYNHCLRGSDSDADEAFVRDLCQKLEIPLTVGRGDVRAYAKEQGLSTEEAARVLRYRFLFAQEGHIATAHHGDDQVETVLINLLRGTGLKGLCAMSPRQDRLLRPLLFAEKRQISTYLEDSSISYCTDRTNFEDDALRNRLRHHILPRLYAENPNLTAAVTRMTGLLRQEDAYLDRAAQKLLVQAAENGGWRCDTLKEADPVLRRRALRQILDEISDPGCAHVEAAEKLLERENGSAFVTLPGGYILRREYGLLRPVMPRTYAPKAVSMTVREVSELTETVDGKTVFALKPGYEIGLRTRLTGDELRLPGGTKSVKKLLIDRKIPVSLRDTLPVITCDGVCAAVCGLGTHTDYAAKPGEPAVIVTLKGSP
jgi:tRNA(Ile)-lysidine synthase